MCELFEDLCDNHDALKRMYVAVTLISWWFWQILWTKHIRMFEQWHQMKGQTFRSQCNQILAHVKCVVWGLEPPVMYKASFLIKIIKHMFSLIVTHATCHIGRQLIISNSLQIKFNFSTNTLTCNSMSRRITGCFDAYMSMMSVIEFHRIINHTTADDTYNGLRWSSNIILWNQIMLLC